MKEDESLAEFLGFMKVIPFDGEDSFGHEEKDPFYDPFPGRDDPIQDYYQEGSNLPIDEYLEQLQIKRNCQSPYLSLALFFYWLYDASCVSRYCRELMDAQSLFLKKLQKSKIEGWNDWDIALLAATYSFEDTDGEEDGVYQPDKAHQLFLLSFSRGNPYAAYKLATEEGYFNKGALILAFEVGFPVSYQLESTLLDPKSPKYDQAFAEEYALLSPFLKNRSCVREVGDRFAAGRGLPKDLNKAKHFHHLAKQMGFYRKKSSFPQD